MKKLICLFFCLALTLSLVSCSLDNTQIAKDEFSKYYNGKNDVVVISYDHILLFEEYEIDLEKINGKEESNNGLIITEDGFYFTTCKDDALFSSTLKIYKSDFKGENIELIYYIG